MTERQSAGQAEEKSARVPLPAEFLERMKGLLGAEFEEFLLSYEKERTRALLLNPLAPEEAARLSARAFHLREVPWAVGGFYYEEEDRPGRHPYHEAGLYYIQEPSAMAAAEFLGALPGERILDLCAAPGGKTVQIAGQMRGQGLLLANEIHPDRAGILSRNVERMGIPNALVMNEDPRRLAGRFPEYFDRILVDAPCSGEGMFRKDEAARAEWSLRRVRLCAKRQGEILDCAAGMLKPGGRMVYSTCTFAPEEDEGVIGAFLDSHPDFTVEHAEDRRGLSPGRPEWAGSGREERVDSSREGCADSVRVECAKSDREKRVGSSREECAKSDREEWSGSSRAECAGCADSSRPELGRTFRIWPHRAEGEGHFIAVLRKRGEGSGGKGAETVSRTAGAAKAARLRDHAENGKRRGAYGEALKAWKEFREDTLLPGVLADTDRLLLFGEQLYLAPEGMPATDGLRVLRPGLHLGTVKKNRLEPSHGLALYLRKEQARRRYSMESGGEEIRRYLRGESLRDIRDVREREAGPKDAQSGSGWVLMLVDGCSVGWARQSGGQLKNHYPKGLRR